MEGVIIFISIILGIVSSCVWGWAVNKVVELKGYSENWFWWGFFFGFLALVVALTKPQCTYYPWDTPQWMVPSANTITPYEENLLKKGGWKCTCGKVNPSYTGTCSCGGKKDTAKPTVQQIQKETTVLEKGGWKCNRCGALNPEFIGFCACGMTRGENKKIDERKNQVFS